MTMCPHAPYAAGVTVGLSSAESLRYAPPVDAILLCADESAREQLIAVNDIHHLDDDSVYAQSVVDEALKPQKYDPLDFWNHVQAQVKRMMQKRARRKLEEKMTDEQLERERSVQRSQLDAISRLVSSTACSLQPVNELDEVDIVHQQLKMYME